MKWITDAGIRCWSCKKIMTRARHVENDGICPFCNCEIDDMDEPYVEGGSDD